ncbi:D-arabinono-1,4-lactone oxidase [Pukyongiella litopenaei]|uniref:FAD-binding protein n=1 Tax=Pukyongiella litopenaei TaxID=2605946 RepID=A0A2S0MQX6_9RHOB|nr:D-arabinono-1,4-lactone oxidase [Pukyongiella litopenaei]AVO38288.1 FAD-binding protein [Pukyongiella litopenaei]
MDITRRKALVAAVAAGAAVPSVRYAGWASRDRMRDDFGAAPAISDGDERWSNWSGLQQATPRQIAVPQDEDELVDLVANSSGRLRPVGSGHSFTGLVPTDDTIVDLGRLAGLVETDRNSRRAWIRAGTRLRHGARLLADEGLGLTNLPDIDVQTFAGSFATATHGTGARLTAIHDHVVSMRMVTPDGSLREISRDSDADLFAAAKVSLGALGIVSSYELQLVETYNLSQRTVVQKTEDLLADAERKFETHRNYEFFLLPNVPLGAEVIHDLYEGEVDTDRQELDANGFLDSLRALRDHAGWAPWLRRQAFLRLAPRGVVEQENGAYWRLLTSSRQIKFNEMEYHIPLENGMKAVREVAALLNGDPDQYFPMEVRRVAQDDAWLSPFNDGPRMSVAVHAAHDEKIGHFFSELEPIFRKHGGRPHWGKLHSLGRDDLAALYPRFDDFNAIRRELDPEGRMLNAHLDHLFTGA